MTRNLLLSAFTLLSATLHAETQVLALSGSLRADSTNKKLLQEAVSIAKQMGATVKVIDLKDFPMPLYDGDLEKSQGLPENAKRLKQMMIEAKAILISSPEYNGSISGVLKNTIDWTTRTSDGQGTRDAYKGKKFAIMSTSPGPSGGANSLAHLRHIITHIGGIVVTTQLALPNGYTAFDQDGLTNLEAKETLKKEVKELLAS